MPTITATAPRTSSNIVSAPTAPSSLTGGRGPGRRAMRSAADGLAAPLLGSDVPQRAGELPAVPGGVLQGALALAVLPVHRLLQHPGAPGAGAGADGVHVVHPDLELVGHLPGHRRPPVPACLGDDHRAVGADGQLGAV